MGQSQSCQILTVALLVQAGCPTPIGTCKCPGELVVYGAGTSCIDFSAIGAQMGLLGPSCRQLAIWLCQIRHGRPDVVLHECTSRFLRTIFQEHLPGYLLYTISKPEEQVMEVGIVGSGNHQSSILLFSHLFSFSIKLVGRIHLRCQCQSIAAMQEIGF